MVLTRILVLIPRLSSCLSKHVLIAIDGVSDCVGTLVLIEGVSSCLVSGLD